MTPAGNPVLARTIAGCFGLGSLPMLRGTAASLAALMVGGLLLDLVGRPMLGIVALAVLGLALWSASEAIRHPLPGAPQEPERLVIADFAGQLLATVAVPLVPAGFALAFLGFRLFMAARIWPFHWYDLGVGRGAGVVLDGVLSAIGAAALVLLSAWALGEPL